VLTGLGLFVGRMPGAYDGLVVGVMVLGLIVESAVGIELN